MIRIMSRSLSLCLLTTTTTAILGAGFLFGTVAAADPETMDLSQKIMEPLSGNDIENDIENDDTGCSISLMIPFDDSRSNLDWNDDDYGKNGSIIISTKEDHVQDGISLLATAVLAIDDFNKRESALVLDGTFDYGCCTQTNTNFSDDIRLFDTLRDASHVLSLQDDWSDSCVVVGIEDNLVANAVMNSLTGADRMMIPIFSYGASSVGDTTTTDSSSNSSSSNFMFGTATFQQRMDALVDYVEESTTMKSSRAALLYAPGGDVETKSYFEIFEMAAERRTDLRVIDSPSSRSRDDLETTLRRLRNMFIDTIVVAWERDDTTIQVLAEVADSLNMLSSRNDNETIQWIFLDSYVSPQYVDRLFMSTNNDDSSPLGRLLSNSVIFQPLDPLASYHYNNYNYYGNGTQQQQQQRFVDIFWKELKHRDGLVDTVNEILQKTPGLNESSIDETFFDDARRRPAYGAGFLYDSIMAAGIFTSCRHTNNNNEGDEEAVSLLDFQGVTGRYQIDVESGTRVSGTVDFGIFAIEKQSDGYVAILTNVTKDGIWVRYEDGQNNNNGAPQEEEESIDEQRLKAYAYILGFTLAGVSFIFCLGSAIFIFRNRKNAIVAMGQPLFLEFVCFGSSFFSFSIIFQSFDDYIIENEKILDVMCMLQVWMAYGGQILVYMALFSKLWRIKKIGKMRKQLVLPRHVIWPFLLFMLVSFGILVAWTITNPSEFDRVEVGVDDDFYTRPTSYPVCTYEVGFQTASQVPLFVSMAVVWYMSYKTRELPERCTDSKRIARVLLSHVLITLFGVILIAVGLAIASLNMVYLIRVLTNFFYAICTVGLLVTPRFRDIRDERKGLNLEGTTGTIQVSGLDMNGVSTNNNLSSGGSSSALATSNGSSGNLSGMNTSGNNRTSMNYNKPKPVSSLTVITENTPVMTEESSGGV